MANFEYTTIGKQMNPKLTRRHAIKGLAISAGIAGFGLGVGHLRAAAPPRLRAFSRVIDVKGRAARVFGLEASPGKTGLEMVLGDDFHARLENDTGTETLIHWHGLTPPSAQDGVPMLSQSPLLPGAAQVYEFANTRAGTHWMHSHVGLQEQLLLAAPLIIRETAEPVFDEQEHVMMLHDFTFRDPGEILAELKRGAGEHAGHAMGVLLNDVAYDAYLCNDRTLDDPEVVSVKRDGQVRLRIINACAASNMWIDLGAIEGEVIAVDGNAVYPMKGSLFPLAIAQRADIRLRIPGDGAFPILFQAEGVAERTGLVLTTAGAQITKVSPDATPAAALDLSFESRLRAVEKLPDEPVTRTEILVLTGGGADCAWGLNGKPSMHDTIFTVKSGERVEIIMRNETGMAHPMHLHGHYFKVVGIGSARIDGALRDTVLVPPKATVTIMFDADNPGNWAFHCHHLYHMNSGMMGAIRYSSAA